MSATLLHLCTLLVYVFIRDVGTSFTIRGMLRYIILLERSFFSCPWVCQYLHLSNEVHFYLNIAFVTAMNETWITPSP